MISSTSSRLAVFATVLASSETTPGAPPCSRISSISRPILRLAQSRGTNPLRVVAPVDRKAELEHPGRPPIVAPEGEFERIFPFVLAEQHDLVPFEYVGDSARDQLARAARLAGLTSGNFGVGEDRPFEPLEYRGDLQLDVLRGQHECRGRAALISDLFEKRRVHIDAHPEGEHPPLMRVALRKLADRRLGGLARRSPGRRS